MSREIFLIRHATPDWGSSLTYHLPPGPSLTTAGLEEAEALGAFLKQSGVRGLFSSPLERCLQTAQIAASATGAQVQVLDDLREWQPGEDPTAVQARMQASLQVGAGAGETQPVGYVTHGGPIAALLKALGMDEAVLESHRVYDHRNPLPPAGVWRLRRDESIHGWGMELVYPPRNH